MHLVDPLVINVVHFNLVLPGTVVQFCTYNTGNVAGLIIQIILLTIYNQDYDVLKL